MNSNKFIANNFNCIKCQQHRILTPTFYFTWISLHSLLMVAQLDMSINMSNNQPVLKYFYLDIDINCHPKYSTMSCSQVIVE